MGSWYKNNMMHSNGSIDLSFCGLRGLAIFYIVIQTYNNIIALTTN